MGGQIKAAALMARKMYDMGKAGASLPQALAAALDAIPPNPFRAQLKAELKKAFSE